MSQHDDGLSVGSPIRSTELVEFLRDGLTEDGRRIVQWMRSGGVPDLALEGVEDRMASHAAAVVRAIETGDYDAALELHGLTDDHPDWATKRDAYRFANRAAYAPLPAQPATSASPQGRRQNVGMRALSWLGTRFSTLLQVGDVILKSVAAAVPIPAAALLEELKGAVEATSAVVANEAAEAYEAGPDATSSWLRGEAIDVDSWVAGWPPDDGHEGESPVG